MYKYEDAVVLIPVNMGSSWTIKKSQKHLPSPVILFPLLTHHKHLPIIFIQVLTREPGNQLDLFFFHCWFPPNNFHPSAYQGILTVVDVFSEWAGPCNAMQNYLKKIKLEVYTNVNNEKDDLIWWWFTTGRHKHSNKYVSWHQKVPRLWTRYKNNHDHKQDHPHDHISTTMKKIINSIIATITKHLQGGRRTSSLRHGSLWLNWGVENVSRVL